MGVEKWKRDESTFENDLRPEFCCYRDEGCEMADSCLNCPFPRCIYEKPHGRQRWTKKARDREIARLFKSKGKGVNELMLIFFGGGRCWGRGSTSRGRLPLLRWCRIAVGALWMCGTASTVRNFCLECGEDEISG